MSSMWPTNPPEWINFSSMKTIPVATTLPLLSTMTSGLYTLLPLDSFNVDHCLKMLSKAFAVTVPTVVKPDNTSRIPLV
ncbi:hypothetical protein WICPIJ_003896 [Wickerhamomyces pijperi]|uniref:Uncharacterized protein n=1 Tax=Wickerhamomyces pijperi TaxID=599730 RepID=A0A9P8TNF8_WICPI|nr:hypothetical protein WICPIJ_003896 [Wickerhamomyces pijperi]